MAMPVYLRQEKRGAEEKKLSSVDQNRLKIGDKEEHENWREATDMK
jgi:hypothetical protein